MRVSRSRRACESISAILTAHGNAAPTRTLTDCCASTSPKGPISACTAPTRLQPWPPPSTRGPERRLIGRHPQRRLTGFSYQPTKIMLRRPLESAQYACADYVERLEARGVAISMSRPGNPYDNAKAESFMKTLKTEEVNGKAYANIEDARRQIGEFIETIYNRQRLHSALGYKPPVEFEAELRPVAPTSNQDEALSLN